MQSLCAGSPVRWGNWRRMRRCDGSNTSHLAARPAAATLPDRATRRPRSQEKRTMRKSLRRLTATVLVLLLPSGLAAADPPGLKTLPIESAAPTFDLPGADGKTHS